MMALHSLLGRIVLSGTILTCTSPVDWGMKSSSLLGMEELHLLIRMSIM
jgi:hypothetical protein